MNGEQAEMIVVGAASAVFGVVLLVQPAALKLSHWSRGARIATAVLAIIAGLGVAFSKAL